MKGKGDEHITWNSAKKIMIVKEREAQNFDARCFYNPQCPNRNSRQHAELFRNESRKITKKNQKEAICAASS